MCRLAHRLEGSAQDHGHYVVSQMLEIPSVGPELLLARWAAGNNDAAAAQPRLHLRSLCRGFYRL